MRRGMSLAQSRSPGSPGGAPWLLHWLTRVPLKRFSATKWRRPAAGGRFDRNRSPSTTSFGCSRSSPARTVRRRRSSRRTRRSASSCSAPSTAAGAGSAPSCSRSATSRCSSPVSFPTACAAAWSMSTTTCRSADRRIGRSAPSITRSRRPSRSCPRTSGPSSTCSPMSATTRRWPAPRISCASTSGGSAPAVNATASDWSNAGSSRAPSDTVQ